jgi:hypothetical protein
MMIIIKRKDKTIKNSVPFGHALESIKTNPDLSMWRKEWTQKQFVITAYEKEFLNPFLVKKVGTCQYEIYSASNKDIFADDWFVSPIDDNDKDIIRLINGK